MSKNWKNIALKTSVGLLLAVVLIGAYVLGSGNRRQTRCAWVEITVEDSLNTPFVTAKKIKQYLSQDFGKLVGMPIDSIDTYKIEKFLDSKTAILKSNVYKTSKGTLNIMVTQRKPVLRFQTSSYGFYCDADGYLLPLEPDYSMDVPVIDGNIPLDMEDCMKGTAEDPQDRRWLEDMLKLSGHISGSVWKERIAQVHCQESGELVIVPREGGEIFLFGLPENMEEKLEKMQMYYERIVAEKGKEAYKVVDVRFKDQIVCKKTE